MDRSEPYRKEVQRFRRKIWKLFGTQYPDCKPACIDCGKDLGVDEGVLMVDNRGFLFFCDDDFFRGEDMKIFWRKVFKNDR